MIVYRINPIDFWAGWMSEEQYLANLANAFNADDDTSASRDEYQAIKARATLAARTRLGWEGDMREGPFIAALPNDDARIEIMIAWKQDNNGDTFVASPRPLLWLAAQRQVELD